jgi:NADH:ubiquinone oxidoreductase subunit F (NADH-binding)
VGRADADQQRRDLRQRRAIIRNGGAWFAAIGTAKSKGTKVFALAGASSTRA